MPDEIDESYARMIRKLDEIELDDLRHGRDIEPDDDLGLASSGKLPE